jgi:hypothetical protein
MYNVYSAERKHKELDKLKEKEIKLSRIPSKGKGKTF